MIRPRPLVLIINATNECPKKCSFCYNQFSTAPKQAFTYDMWKAVKDALLRLEKIQPYVPTHLWFLGGDPLCEVELLLTIENDEFASRFFWRFVFTGLPEELIDHLFALDPKFYQVCYHIGEDPPELAEAKLELIRKAGFKIGRPLLVLTDDNIHMWHDYVTVVSRFEESLALLPPMQGFKDEERAGKYCEDMFRWLLSLDPEKDFLLHPSELLTQWPLLVETVSLPELVAWEKAPLYTSYFRISAIELHIDVDGKALEHLVIPRQLDLEELANGRFEYLYYQKLRLKNCLHCKWLILCGGGHAGSAYVVTGDPLAKWPLCDFHRRYVFPYLWEYIWHFRSSPFYKKRVRKLGWTDEDLRRLYEAEKSWVESHE